MADDWPGNVRERKHAIVRLSAMYSEGALEAALPAPVRQVWISFPKLWTANCL
ncbi:MAG TPA: hypothetical protein VKB88_13060 [Bryobacteraceae bacterium]|nr:hypothetical protein [Bryobacteraceae bacterium]